MSEHSLRGEATILFISHDTCSDSTAKMSHAYFWGIAQLSRYVAKWVSHRCACVKLSIKGGFGNILVFLSPPLKSIVRYGVSQQ